MITERGLTYLNISSSSKPQILQTSFPSFSFSVSPAQFPETASLPPLLSPHFIYVYSNMLCYTNIYSARSICAVKVRLAIPQHLDYSSKPLYSSSNSSPPSRSPLTSS
uniref:Uncharacterized protein n=1 Tax=Opuntia streptacantha TaxID=393608 RepID=A0A7C9E5H9_OPUST